MNAKKSVLLTASSRGGFGSRRARVFGDGHLFWETAVLHDFFGPGSGDLPRSPDGDEICDGVAREFPADRVVGSCRPASDPGLGRCAEIEVSFGIC